MSHLGELIRWRRNVDTTFYGIQKEKNYITQATWKFLLIDSQKNISLQNIKLILPSFYKIPHSNNHYILRLKVRSTALWYKNAFPWEKLIHTKKDLYISSNEFYHIYSKSSFKSVEFIYLQLLSILVQIYLSVKKKRNTPKYINSEHEIYFIIFIIIILKNYYRLMIKNM